MVRIPALPVALLLALALIGASYGAVPGPEHPVLVWVLLPASVAAGALVSARWALWTPPVPGLALGLLVVACEMGLGLRWTGYLFSYTSVSGALVQIIAALIGGAVGALLAQRARGAQAAEPARYRTAS